MANQTERTELHKTTLVIVTMFAVANGMRY